MAKDDKDAKDNIKAGENKDVGNNRDVEEEAENGGGCELECLKPPYSIFPKRQRIVYL